MPPTRSYTTESSRPVSSHCLLRLHQVLPVHPPMLIDGIDQAEMQHVPMQLSHVKNLYPVACNLKPPTQHPPHCFAGAGLVVIA